jgi:hypothetical protein
MILDWNMNSITNSHGLLAPLLALVVILFIVTGRKSDQSMLPPALIKIITEKREFPTPMWLQHLTQQAVKAHQSLSPLHLKRKMWLVIIFLHTVLGFAQEKEDLASSETSNQPIFKQGSPLLETKASYFFFASSDLNKIYQKGGFQVQLSGFYPIWRGLQVYGSTGFSEAWGCSRSLHQNTSLWQLSVDLGLKPILTIASFAQYYFSLGPRYFYAHQHNSSSYVRRIVVKNGAGLFVNTGFNFFPMPHLIIDIFGEYAYEPVNCSSRSNIYGNRTQLSLFSFGAGIGYTF